MATILPAIPIIGLIWVGFIVRGLFEPLDHSGDEHSYGQRDEVAGHGALNTAGGRCNHD